MASLQGARFDISGASGSQGLLAPKDGWRAFFLPRGGYASVASTGNLITFDSASVASRFSLNDWVQVGLDQTTIRQVSGVGGNSIGLAGSAVTVGVNDRILVFGQTQPTVSGGSATYTSPNTVIRQRDDDTSTVYANSMITTNASGLVQAFAATALYDVILQDGNRTNQGSIIDLEIGVAQGVSVTDWAFFGSTVTMHSTLGVTGTVTLARGPADVRFADSPVFTKGSSTAGIQEAINDLGGAPGTVILSGITYTVLSTITVPARTRLIGQGRGTVILRGWNPTYDGNNGSVVSLNGAQSEIADLVVDGNNSVFTGSGDGALINRVDDCDISRVHVRNYTVFGINIQNGGTNRIRSNRVVGTGTQNARAGIYVNTVSGSGDCQRNTITGNDIDVSAATDDKGIGVASLVAGKKVDGTVIAGNRVVSGQGTGIAVLSRTGGDLPTGVCVTGNPIIAGRSSSASGGISMDTCGPCEVTGNNLDVRQYSWANGIEIVSSTDVAVTGNAVVCGSSVTRGISIDKSSDCTVVGNRVKGFASAGQGILVSPNVTGTTSSGNVISANRVSFASGMSGTGIYVRNGAASGTLDRNVVTDNIVTGDGTAAQTGLKLGALSSNSGNQRFNSVRGNLFHNLPLGIEILENTALRDALCSDNQFQSVTTVVSATGIQQEITAAGNSLSRIFSNRVDLIGDTSFTLTSTPTMDDGYDGQIVTITKVSGAGGITLQDQGTLAGSNLRLQATSRSLGARDSVTLRYEATVGDWIEQWYSNVI